MHDQKDLQLLIDWTVYHILETQPIPWDAINEGTKSFEVRKNDRGYKEGDLVVFAKHSDEVGLTNEVLLREIHYLVKDEINGIQKGYCVFGIREIEEELDLDPIKETIAVINNPGLI